MLFRSREDIFEVKDLKEGMICPGLVTNVTNFGAFVDIGVHQDGLVHISDLTWSDNADEELKSYTVGQKVEVKVLGVEPTKERISLGIKQLDNDNFRKELDKIETNRS